ncbi:MAG: TlpA family protein disulfide reductase [Bacteroidota bacterium]
MTLQQFFQALSLLLCLSLCTCDLAPKTSPPLPEFGTATTPRIYDNFSQVASLFEQQSDTTYVVNFWATWCKPCREEIPYLQQLAQEEADQDVVVVLVSLDTEANAIERIPALLKNVAPTLPSIVLTDEDPAWGKTIDRVWTGNLPTTIIYRKDLRFVYRRNFRTYLDLQSALAPFIG